MEEVSLPIAYGAGVVAFVSPCVLPLVPIYLANLAGVVSLSTETKRWVVCFHALSFVIGFTIFYTAVGASAGLIGWFIPANTLRLISGTVILVFGIIFLASLKIPWLNYWFHWGRPFWGKVGYLRSALMGMAFAFGIGPCTGYILGGILTLAAKSQTAGKGASLLAVYSLGLGMPFLAISLLLERAFPIMNWLKRRSSIIIVVSGLLLIVIGILMLVDVFPTTYF